MNYATELKGRNARPNLPTTNLHTMEEKKISTKS